MPNTFSTDRLAADPCLWTVQCRPDPCDPQSWALRPLRYSAHAEQRCEERNIPQLFYLPPDSRLSDRDLGDRGVETVLFMVPRGDDAFFLLLNVDGCVITTFRKGSRREYAVWREAKERRRRLVALAV